MRYYVVRVEYNKVAQAENRQIYGFDTLDEAKKKFHEIMRDDINNATLSKALCVVLNERGGVEIRENWEKQAEPEVEE